MAMLGKKIQGSDSKASHANNVGPFGKILLALFLANVTLQMVTGDEVRISQGVIPPAGKYPAIGRIKSGNRTSTFCVLSILTRDWLVAPATCFSFKSGLLNLGKISVVVGDEILNETEPYEQVVKIERFIVHHRFEGWRATNNDQIGDDIAVAKVTPPIKFSNRVTATNLPTCKDVLEPGIGTIVGYGEGVVGGRRQWNHRLTEITNKIISHEECRKFKKNFPLDDRVFCVQAINNMSSCFYDFGAPLYRVKSDSEMVLLGFMSKYPYGLCGVDEQVAVFTRVSSYVGWIHRRISGCGNHPWLNVTKVREPTPDELASDDGNLDMY